MKWLFFVLTMKCAVRISEHLKYWWYNSQAQNLNAELQDIRTDTLDICCGPISCLLLRDSSFHWGRELCFCWMWSEEKNIRMEHIYLRTHLERKKKLLLKIFMFAEMFWFSSGKIKERNLNVLLLLKHTTLHSNTVSWCQRWDSFPPV